MVTQDKIESRAPYLTSLVAAGLLLFAGCGKGKLETEVDDPVEETGDLEGAYFI